MKLEEYKSQAITRLNKSIAHNEKEKMNYACMGLFEETGEVIAEFRKPLFKGNFHEKPLDIEDIKSELGDLMWYLALICKNTDIDMNQFKPIYNDKEKINVKLAVPRASYISVAFCDTIKCFDNNKFNISLVLVTLLVSSFISSITVGGKAIGKRYAIKNADKIIFVVAKVLNRFKFKK